MITATGMNLANTDEVFDYIVRRYGNQWLSHANMDRRNNLARLVAKRWNVTMNDVLELADSLGAELTEDDRITF